MCVCILQCNAKLDKGLGNHVVMSLQEKFFSWTKFFVYQHLVSS